MKSTILSLVLASVLGLMYGNPNSGIIQEPDDLELRTLLTKRRDHLQKYHEVISARMKLARTRDPEDSLRVMQARELLLRSELELASSVGERIALLERALADMEEFKDNYNKISLTEGGRYSLLLESECLRIEIELHKTKKAQ